MSNRWAVLRDGVILHGPGALPYFWTDPATGDPHQMHALDETARAALGWQEVEVREAREIREGIELELAPVVTIEDSQVVETKQYAFAPSARTVMAGLVDEWAEGIRSQVAQSRPLQTMVYQAKAAEAVAFLADPEPVEANYPLLSASVGIEGETLSAVATLVSTRQAQWTLGAKAVERARLMALKLIQEALTDEDANTILEDVLTQVTLEEVIINQSA